MALELCAPSYFEHGLAGFCGIERLRLAGFVLMINPLLRSFKVRTRLSGMAWHGCCFEFAVGNQTKAGAQKTIAFFVN